MAASSEIRFKIGGDTSALSKEFAALPAKAAAAGTAAGKAYGGRMATATTAAAAANGSGGIGTAFTQVLERKLGLKDAIKGIFQGIGIGSVQGITDLIVRPFELGYQRAKDLLGVTTRLRDITRAEITAGAGRNVTLRETQREINDLNTDLALQRTLVADLKANPLTYSNPNSLAMLREAEQELGNLQVRQAELTSQLTTEEKLRAQAVRATAREQNTLFELNDAELRNASDREKIQIRLNALTAEYNRLAKRGDNKTAAGDANFAAQNDLRRQLALLDKAAREQRSATLTGLGQTLAGGTVGRRSERERLADRGADFATRADAAIRSGATPAYIARLVAAANRDFQTVGGKVRTSTSAIARDDANSLGGQLITANETLKKIEANLTPTSVK